MFILSWFCSLLFILILLYILFLSINLWAFDVARTFWTRILCVYIDVLLGIVDFIINCHIGLLQS